MGNTCVKKKDDSYVSAHTMLMTEFVNQYCVPDEFNGIPLSNFIGCYWNFVAKVKSIKWSYGLEDDTLIDVLHLVLRQFDKNTYVIGPEYKMDIYNYRTVIGVRFNTYPVIEPEYVAK